MGLRLRKSVKIGPVRVNLSKTGIGYSTGVKGYRVTKRADGRTQTTYSIPGTGIGYVNTSSGDKQTSKKQLFAGKDGKFSWTFFIAWIILTFILYKYVHFF